MKKILLLEDNYDYVQSLVNLLHEDLDIQLDHYKKVEEIKESDLKTYDLFLLDWEIKDSKKDGLSLCKQIKQDLKIQTPVIMVTGKMDEVSISMGLREGAIDYIAKPLNLKHLVIKIKNHLNQTNNDAAKVIEYKDIVLNFEDFSVKYKGEKIPLTKKPFLILFYMLKNPSKVYSRDEINSKINKDVTVINRNVDTHIVKIRKKFDAVGVPNFVKTISGFGYKLNY